MFKLQHITLSLMKFCIYYSQSPLGLREAQKKEKLKQWQASMKGWQTKMTQRAQELIQEIIKDPRAPCEELQGAFLTRTA